MDLTAQKWADQIHTGIKSVDDGLLAQAARIIWDSKLILTAGNGGSSSLASHLAQAIAKPGYVAGGGRPAICLNDNVPTLTAHANDSRWEDALMECARPYLIAVPGCAFALISSSGRSENICRLAKLAADHKCSIITFTGFTGSPLRDRATVALHVASDDYEVVEPAHDALIHRLQYHLRRRDW